MPYFLKRYKAVIILIFYALFCSSCVLDEFKFSEIEGAKWETDRDFDVVAPLFKGVFEFKDLINDDTPVEVLPGEPISVLSEREGNLLTVPSRSIFDSSSIIDYYNFMIQGRYSLDSINLEYRVSNGCPFPLNIQMRFTNDKDSTYIQQPIIPNSFLPAKHDGNNYVPVYSRQTLVLNNEQIESLSSGELMEFSTWFNDVESINKQDTFLSYYPVRISIILYGGVKLGND